MKVLVSFYSKTGNTRRVALEIARDLKADVDELTDFKNRGGILGYVVGCKDTIRKKFATIKQAKNPSKYEITVVGTPIWAFNIVPAIRTYLSKNKFKKVAFFCTFGGKGDKKVFKDMEKICKKPVAIMSLIDKKVKRGDYKKEVEKFCKKIEKK